MVEGQDPAVKSVGKFLYWMNLQAHYDLEVEKDRLGPRLEEVEVLKGK